jgi:hypothetical protein
VSEQLNVTATSVLFQPLELGGGDTLPEILGKEVSSTVTMKFSPATLPEASIPVQLIIVAPSGNTVPEDGSQSTTGLGSTASDALFAKMTRAPSLLLASVLKLAGSISLGGVISLTVTGKLPLLEFPAASVAVQATVMEPRGNTEPDAGLQAMLGGGPESSTAVAV